MNEQAQLAREFALIDTDGSGKIDKQEMNNFLAQKGIDEDHRLQIIDVVFSACDLDGNGLIELNEFIGHFINTKDQLVSREQDLTNSIKIANQRLREAKENLQRA